MVSKQNLEIGGKQTILEFGGEQTILEFVFEQMILKLGDVKCFSQFGCEHTILDSGCWQ